MNVVRSKFFQAVLVLLVVFLIFPFCIRPDGPSTSDSWRSFVAPIRSTVMDDSKRAIRLVLMVLLPLLFGYYAYTQAAAGIEAPAELRAIHPAPPASISFRGKTLH